LSRRNFNPSTGHGNTGKQRKKCHTICPLTQKALQHSSTVNAARESAAEIYLLRTGLEELFASDLDDKTPLALISGALTMPGESKKMRGIIQRAHEQAVANHAGSRFITAERSGHNVPITEPAVVAESVMRFFK
ncbi:hypothetical protein, partial [Leucobacter sp. OH1287]|uniref:hypothetical protein n=1 Tax=Leucobacter sp. OH1287 TaxID=2491049 RepID=UPI001F28E3E2